jgi:hypothetical protein
MIWVAGRRLPTYFAARFGDPARWPREWLGAPVRTPSATVTSLLGVVALSEALDKLSLPGWSNPVVLTVGVVVLLVAPGRIDLRRTRRQRAVGAASAPSKEPENGPERATNDP